MATVADRVYARAPVVLQHAMVSAFGARWHWRRFGPGFQAELAGFAGRMRNTAEQWREYQTAQLRELLTVATTRIPYYQRAWRGLGLDAGAIDRFELADLRSLPLLDKDAARAEPEAFCIDGHPAAGATVCPTSGSTGTPVRVYVTNADFRRGMALREARSCLPAGVSFKLPRATFSGRLVVPDARSTGPFHRFNIVERQVYFSAFHLSPQNAAAYLRPLNRHRIVWGTGYTHAWEQLAGFMLEQGLPPPPSLRAIITTSEKLTPSGRTTIEKAFACRVFQEYGTVEDALFACEHEDGRLRLSPDAGILELRRSDGTIIPADSDEQGETITTAFIRRNQLFIRYRLGDVAAWDQRPDELGLGMPILADVVGRLEDIIVGPDGRRSVRFHGIFTEVAGVREAQVIQEARDRLRILVVPSASYGEATVREITSRIHARLTTDMHVDVERVDAIPRTAAGKLKAVVNRMPQ
ncbi:MAG: phenylacetate--CoA ligase family protein [Deltaproteobacteria bacterium]|nr:phenylacetate--CoA ligase family protein [Deltaproteobacteria bacterium]